MAVYTVAQVTSHLRQSFERDPMLADLWVVGEISNLRVSSSGHSYFTLKDDQSVLNCVMFRGQPGSELLAVGTEVSAHGRITFYEPRGSTDFMVDLAMPQGVGELSLELERLRLRLEAEGLFEPSRKRPLPQFPGVVGVVTSPAGSVFHDIQNVVRRRYPLVELVLSPTQVQGAEAAPMIVAALERLERDNRASVVIIARGGGSLEELGPFNEEAVARAIYASKVPIVSAIGHETDFTIADYVADVRAPTPSAAAELVVPDQYELRRRLAALADFTHRAAAHRTQSNKDKLSGILRRMESGLPDLATWRRRVDDLSRGAHSGWAARIGLARSRTEGMEYRLKALDPAATLGRGFSVVENRATGRVVTSAAHAEQGDPLAITVTDGTILATSGEGSKPPVSSKKRRLVPQPQPMERLL